MSRRHLHRLIAACVILASSACGSRETDTTPVEPDPVAKAVSGDAAAVAAAMGRGVNFGNILEAPSEGAWGLQLSDALFDAAKAAGVKTIRLPVRWSNHTASVAPFPINPAFLARVDYAVDAALSRGMRIVVNMHHYRQLDGDALDAGETAVPSNVVDDRFVAIWAQLAARYRNRPETLIYELYNEPHGRLTADRWNALYRRALAAVRAVDTTHYVIIGPVEWNSASKLDALTLPPEDQRLIATIHNYNPFAFTHQGAEWAGMANSPVTTCCTGAQLASLSDPLRTASRWQTTAKRPVFVGEFGSYSKAPYASRVIYTRAIRDSIEAHGMPWAYWEMASGFGLYDPDARTFRTELRDALFF